MKIKIVGVLLVVLVSLGINCNYTIAKSVNGQISKNLEDKNFELPSKLHKDGEGFYEIGRMLTPRYQYSSILLNDGRLLIVGGSKK